MKVAVGPGQVELRDAPEPQAGAGQLVIEVAAAGICGTDLHILDGEFPTRPPVVMGHEVSGRIAALGAEVQGFALGDRVTTETYFSTCGACRYCRDGQRNLCADRRSIGSAVDGAFARYLVVPSAGVHALPAFLSDQAGALTEPLACVAHGVWGAGRGVAVGPGDVAVVAGPGAIGLLTAQVAKAAGATTIVLGTEADRDRLRLASALGADHAITVESGEAVALVRGLTAGGHGADVVFECSGAGPSARGLLDLVRRRGRFVQLGLFGKAMAWDLDQLCYRELVVTGSNASTPASWRRALELIATRAVDLEALVSATYPLSAWSEAFEDFRAKEGVKLILDPAG